MTDASLLSQSLLSHLVPAGVTPLSSREYWSLTRIAPVGELEGLSAEEIGARFGAKPAVAERVPALLGRSRALALAVEELEHKGFWVITADAERYPARLRERLGDAAPAMLYGVGDVGLLSRDGIGVVGSRDIGHESVEVAAQVARFASSRRVPVVSGGARGVDQQAMNAAFEAGGTVVGVLADSLLKTAGEQSVRRAIASGLLCLVTPYSPSAPFSTGNAMGRNKIIYALARGTVVVRSDLDTGGTWAGATEAIAKHYGAVWSWLGAGTGPGNEPLVGRGAKALDPANGFDAILSDEPIPDAAGELRESVAVTLF